MKTQRTAPLFILLCVMVLSDSLLFGGNDIKNLENQLQKLYQDKTFVLRNFYTGNKLKYNPEGVRVSGGEQGVWTLDGLITINRLKVKNERIELTGKREFWSYDQEEKRPRQFKSSEKTIIDIGPFNTSPDAASVNRAIREIFLKDDEPLHKAVPDYWENAVLTFFNKNDNSINESAKKKYFNRSDNLILPKLISKTEPQYTPIARQLKVRGTLILKVKIDKEGNVSIQDIVIPLGLDLEESAIKAISKWKYTPASLNGEPIDFEATLKMQFYIGS